MSFSSKKRSAEVCCVLVVALCFLLAMTGNSGTNLPAASSRTSGRETTTNNYNIGAAEAFTKALGLLHGRVNMFDTNGVIEISRVSAPGWKLELRGYKELPSSDLLVFVADSGTISTELKSGADANAWIRSTPPGPMGSGKSLRPEVAFRKAIASLKYHPSKVNLLETKGSISLRRTEYDLWFMRLSGYSGTSLQGIGVIVEDNGNTQHKIAF